MSHTFQVVKDSRERMLITDLDNATMGTIVIDCTIKEALDLMWKIHRAAGGNGTLTRR